MKILMRMMMMMMTQRMMKRKKFKLLQRSKLRQIKDNSLVKKIIQKIASTIKIKAEINHTLIKIILMITINFKRTEMEKSLISITEVMRAILEETEIEEISEATEEIVEIAEEIVEAAEEIVETAEVIIVETAEVIIVEIAEEIMETIGETTEVDTKAETEVDIKGEIEVDTKETKVLISLIDPIYEEHSYLTYYSV
eukprot:GHVR01117318.1.p1 GENE.GHVR01117318.1~~GHVR01117318.1.p1  ORF type:complete len:197 (-),score=33.60 GHVR01117318.1:3757-4347(-)